jgi:hypothetical protein
MDGENGRRLKLGVVIRIPCAIIDALEHEELLRWVWRPVWSVDERTDGLIISIIIAGTNRHVALRKRGRFYIHTAMLNSHLGDDGLEAQVF